MASTSRSWSCCPGGQKGFCSSSTPLAQMIALFGRSVYIYIFGYLWAHSLEAGIDCFFFISSFDCPIPASWRGTSLIPGFHLLALILSMAQIYWTVESWLTHHMAIHVCFGPGLPRESIMRLWQVRHGATHLLILCLSLTQKLAAHDV